jgi:hypothetical protein
MGFQPISPRKTKRISERTGLDVERAIRCTNRRWYLRVGDPAGEHQHYWCDPTTGAFGSDQSGAHWSTCGSTEYARQARRDAGYAEPPQAAKEAP